MQCQVREFRSEWVSDAMTLIAVAENECLGFGSLQSQGRISALFVAPGYGRQGIASQLLAHLLAEARSRGFEVVAAEASEFSRSLFGKYGFSVTEVEHTRFRGVAFTRYAMRAHISGVRRG
jgi:putative acetyltransferase